jgi:Family of unknown function (DUF6221)
MSDLVEFLQARLDEWEAKARAAMHGSKGVWTHVDPVRRTGAIEDDRGETVVYDEGSPTGEQADHIVANDPARVLREVEAKRQLVREISTLTEFDWGEPDGSTRSDYVEAFRRVLRIHALPYADHPDYREEWKP